MKRAGGACPRGTHGSRSLNAAYHKEQQYIWFMGGDLNGFRDTFYEMKGWGHNWDPWSVSLNAPHHKEQEYIWFMGRDMNSFREIKHFVK